VAVAALEVEQLAHGHGLLHGLKHLSLHNQHLLKRRWRGRRWVDIMPVLPIVVLSVVVATVPYVGHLKHKR
jgi:hypothetical protein